MSIKAWVVSVGLAVGWVGGACAYDPDESLEEETETAAASGEEEQVASVDQGLGQFDDWPGPGVLDLCESINPPPWCPGGNGCIGADCEENPGNPCASLTPPPWCSHVGPPDPCAGNNPPHWCADEPGHGDHGGGGGGPGRCVHAGDRLDPGERCCERLKKEHGRCVIPRWAHCDLKNAHACEQGTRCQGGSASPHHTPVCVPKH